MPAQEMKGILIRLTSVEHALLQTILREEAFTMQTFFRQAAKRKIQQRARAFAALEGEAGEDGCIDPEHNNAPPGLDTR
jgi:hypothetical protein